MSEVLTTYTVKSRKDGFLMVFKYHLNGELKAFEILEGQLDTQQQHWLFIAGNFPHNQTLIRHWAQNLKKHFEIHRQDPEVTFEAFWTAYGLKTRKKETQDYWKKMTDGDRFKALAGIRKYDNHLRLYPWKNKVDPIRYLRNRRYEDEF